MWARTCGLFPRGDSRPWDPADFICGIRELRQWRLLHGMHVFTKPSLVWAGRPWDDECGGRSWGPRARTSYQKGPQNHGEHNSEIVGHQQSISARAQSGAVRPAWGYDARGGGRAGKSGPHAAMEPLCSVTAARVGGWREEEEGHGDTADVGPHVTFGHSCPELLKK